MGIRVSKTNIIERNKLMKIITNPETVAAIKEIIDQQENQPSMVRLYVAGFG